MSDVVLGAEAEAAVEVAGRDVGIVRVVEVQEREERPVPRAVPPAKVEQLPAGTSAASLQGRAARPGGRRAGRRRGPAR